MADDAGFWQLSAFELIAGFRRREFSPVEAARSVIGRIEEIEPRVNAFALFDPESALNDARASEQRWFLGKPLGPVDGVPVAIKDLILAKGWPTHRGSLAVKPGQQWTEDAPATARVRESGAVLLGKTTTAEFGWKGLSDCPATGITRNPWNPKFTAGGSSGGAAAGAAAGFGPLHIATDGAGSGRMPASHTGVVGFKPTLGRVAVYPYSQNGTLFNVTPMTRTVRDAALLFDVIARPDLRDWNSLPPVTQSWQQDLEKGVAGLKIAFSRNLGYAEVDPEVSALVSKAVRIFEELGAFVEECDPGIEDPMPVLRTIWTTGAARLLKSLGEEDSNKVEIGLREIAAEGRQYDAVTFASALEQREALGRHFLHFHQRWDLLVTPMVAQPASEIVESTVGLEKHMPRPSFTYLSPLAYPFNLTQQPAITVPCGFTAAGLPVGLQIVGNKYADAKVLQAAFAFEQARPALPAFPVI